MAWSQAKLCSAIGLSEDRLQPGCPLLCECKGLDVKGNAYSGMKAEVHLDADGHRLDLLVSRWAVSLPQNGVGKGNKSRSPVQVEALLRLHLVRNSQGGFEFASAFVGDDEGGWLAPSYEKALLETFYQTASSLSKNTVADVPSVWHRAMMGNICDVLLGAGAVPAALPFKESLPADVSARDKEPSGPLQKPSCQPKT